MGLEAFSEYGVDRFFFTDVQAFGAVCGWTAVHVPQAPDQNGIPGARVSTKRLKFRGHEVLAPYRYVMHMDTARRALRMARRALKMGLRDYVRCHPEHALFVRAHLTRRTVREEVEFLKAMPPRQRETLQPTGPLLAWDAFLRPLYSELGAVRHPELCLWVRDTTAPLRRTVGPHPPGPAGARPVARPDRVPLGDAERHRAGRFLRPLGQPGGEVRGVAWVGTRAAAQPTGSSVAARSQRPPAGCVPARS